ncbi:hypothetical protein J5Y09_10185 [Roseomonas sp. PWR1]|uniref:Uncharacterized protein n=1 Tax=Roseomonas nitratireducens TaxID=2820810 RepID=A0ABS4ASE4_9PROT|nr:hypothetical protein [Neoroseomonas nitratireducens]MBP0464282.1 hypothetical protein [Neoroseomonas nitratireducens]
MDDKDRVFARFKDDKPEPADRREVLNIPRRNGATGSRTVQVVHLRSGGPAKDRAQRPDAQLRAASWDDGFPAKKSAASQVFGTPPAAQPAAQPAAPRAHVMPAWAPAEPPAAPPPAEAPEAEIRRGRGRPRKEIAASPSRQVADPFDAADDGANCLRCGYRVEPARERRGLLTCAGCDGADRPATA